MLATIFWDFPNHIPLFGFELRYYSLMFIISFVLGQYGMQYIFKKENISPKLMDSLVYWMIGATIVGARLGHVLFYEFDEYFGPLKWSKIELKLWGINFPSFEIPRFLAVWEGGLASHGAAIAIVAAMIYWSRKYAKVNPLWTLDRIVLVVALAAGFIRMGNWFNSEIYGAQANSVFETVFVEDAAQDIKLIFEKNFKVNIKDINFEPSGKVLQKNSLVLPELDLRISFYQSNEMQTSKYANELLPAILKGLKRDNQNILMLENTNVEVHQSPNGWEASTKVYGIPRYPTQLFEAGTYWIIFIILTLLYLKRGAGNKAGFLLGLFLTMLFGFRFFIEFYKEIQVSFENSMSLNMGQWLSIPMVSLGLFLIFRAQKKYNS